MDGKLVLIRETFWASNYKWDGVRNLSSSLGCRQKKLWNISPDWSGVNSVDSTKLG